MTRPSRSTRASSRPRARRARRTASEDEGGSPARAPRGGADAADGGGAARALEHAGDAPPPRRRDDDKARTTRARLRHDGALGRPRADRLRDRGAGAEARSGTGQEIGIEGGVFLRREEG